MPSRLVLGRRSLALALLVVPLARSGSALAQAQTASQFLASIYEPYRKADFKGQPYREARRFFTADLAAAMDKDYDEAKKRKEVPTLDGDPFIDAQDWKIDSLAYATTTAGDKASGAVTFTNLGEPKGVVLSLVKTPSGWRISEIIGAGGSLRALFKLK